MAQDKRDNQKLVFTLIVAVSLLFAGVIGAVLFFKLPGLGPAPANPSVAAQAAYRAQSEPAPVDERMVSEDEDERVFGTGAADDFEDGDFKFGTGQWAIRGWGHMRRGGEFRPDVVSTTAGIAPIQGEKMAMLRNKAAILRKISLREALTPQLSFYWAVSNLNEGESLQVLIGNNPVLTLDHTAPQDQWVKAQVDLSSHAGKMVMLRIELEGSPDTRLFIDDVVINEP